MLMFVEDEIRVKVRSYPEYMRDCHLQYSDSPEASVSSLAVVRAAVQELPPAVKLALSRWNWSFVVVKCCSHYWGVQERELSKGYLGLCLYKDRVLLISERFRMDNLNRIIVEDVHHTVQHETGHALDQVLRDKNGVHFSSTPHFVEAVGADVKQLGADPKSKWWWLANLEDVRMRQELFANIFVCTSTAAYDSLGLERAFPRTTALLKDKLRREDIILPPDKIYQKRSLKSLDNCCSISALVV